MNVLHELLLLFALSLPFPPLSPHPLLLCASGVLCSCCCVRATGIKMNKKFTRRRILCAKCSKYKQQQFSTAPYNAVMILSIIKRVAAVRVYSDYATPQRIHETKRVHVGSVYFPVLCTTAAAAVGQHQSMTQMSPSRRPYAHTNYSNNVQREKSSAARSNNV